MDMWKMIFTLLGVALAVLGNGQSVRGDVNAELAEGAASRSGMAIPEVLLQLKYDQGELDRIYLTQFRKDPATAPSVPAGNRLCADLCYAGLGGEACGATCTDLMPVGLATALRSENQSSAQYGEPRIHVCPALCTNRLGTPLCNCPALQDNERDVNWDEVCAAFCMNDGYVLGGCPACADAPRTSVASQRTSRVLDTAEGWVSWCNVQCRQGHGGAACNCDRAPFQ